MDDLIGFLVGAAFVVGGLWLTCPAWRGSPDLPESGSVGREDNMAQEGCTIRAEPAR